MTAKRSLPIAKSSEPIWAPGLYGIARSRDVKAKKPARVRRFGKELVLFRDERGAVVAADARCPHRGADLGLGQVKNGHLECGYHGLRFSSSGECTKVPCEGSTFKAPARLALRTYPVQEAHDIIWLAWGDIAADTPIPWRPGAPTGRRGMCSEVMEWEAPFERAVEAQLDAHHFPFAHRRASFGLVGERLDPFDVEVLDDGETVRMKGRLRKESAPGDKKAFEFEFAMTFPGTLVGTVAGQTVTGALAPIDVDQTHILFQYRSDVPLVGKLIAWLSVKTEMLFVQPDDERLVVSAGQGFDTRYNCYLPADAAFLAWHKIWRLRSAEVLSPACGSENDKS